MAAPAMASTKSFSDNYMLLTHQDAGLHDLIRILFHSDIEKRKFVDSPQGTEESFKYRWLIFVSIFVQKILQLVAGPLAWFGNLVEMWLNLLSCNRNAGVLMLNVMRGWFCNLICFLLCDFIKLISYHLI